MVDEVLSHGVLVIDQQGRRWCMLGANGFTRVDGVWWWGSHAGLVCEVTAPALLDALAEWSAQRADLLAPMAGDVEQPAAAAAGRVS